MTALFITATGADVGETFVTATLIRYLRQMGHSVDAIKPIVSGYDPAHATASEPAILLRALGLAFSPEQIERISPWRFRAALSPDMAALREGRSIDVDQLIAFCRRAVERRRGVLLIEGVGGVMVPLHEQRTILDVMMALRLPLILTTGSYPGSVSHVLTALDSLFQRDMNVLVTVVCETPGSGVPLDEAVATIARFAEPVIGVAHTQRESDAGGGSAFNRIFHPGGRRAPGTTKAP